MSRANNNAASRPAGLFYFPAGASAQGKSAAQRGTRSKRGKRRRRKKKKAKPKMGGYDTSHLVSTVLVEDQGGPLPAQGHNILLSSDPSAKRKAASPLFIPDMGFSAPLGDVGGHSEGTVDSDSGDSVDDGRREFEAFLERKLLREKAAAQRHELDVRGDGTQLPGVVASTRHAQLENRPGRLTSKVPRAKVPDPKEQSRELDAIRRSFEDARRVSIE